MHRTRTAHAVGLALAIAAGTSLSLAQPQAPKGGGGGPAAAPLASSPAAPDAAFTLDFPGGTVAEYVTTLRRIGAEHGIRVNIASSATANATTIPAISLRDATLSIAVFALQQGTAGETVQLRVSEGDGLFGVSTLGAPSTPQPAQGPFAGRTSAADVVSLRPLIDTGADPKAPGEESAVLAAIEAGIATAPRAKGAAPPVLKFHKDTGLLFVAGAPTDIELVRATVERLQADRRRGGLGRAKVAERQADLGAQAAKAVIELRFHEQDFGDARSEFNRISELYKAGNASDEVRRDAELKLRRAERDYELFKVEFERIQKLQAATADFADPIAEPMANAAAAPRTDELHAQIERLAARLDQLARRLDAIESRHAGDQGK